MLEKSAGSIMAASCSGGLVGLVVCRFCLQPIDLNCLEIMEYVAACSHGCQGRFTPQQLHSLFCRGAYARANRFPPRPEADH